MGTGIPLVGLITAPLTEVSVRLLKMGRRHLVTRLIIGRKPCIHVFMELFTIVRAVNVCRNEGEWTRDPGVSNKAKAKIKKRPINGIMADTKTQRRRLITLQCCAKTAQLLSINITHHLVLDPEPIGSTNQLTNKCCQSETSTRGAVRSSITKERDKRESHRAILPS